MIHGVSRLVEVFQETGRCWGDKMPSYLKLKITWPDEYGHSVYVMARHEIEELLINYNQTQALLFTFVEPELLKQWLWDVYCREPDNVEVTKIKF